MKEELIFKPRARLLLQLGDQLIKNASIALLELAKNSYDADANNVTITMRNLTDPAKGTIVIEDDGIGMDASIIKDIWMEPGSDHKAKLFAKQKRTLKFTRLPIGEKGIGRFGAHKLGNEIELVSRMQGSDEVYLKIDWADFQKEKYLKDVPVSVYIRKPEVFTDKKAGTKITIRNLHSPWTRGMVRDVFRSINALSSPFDTPESFYVSFDVDEKEWLEKLMSWDEISNYTLYRFKCQIQGKQITSFDYGFTPFPTMVKLKSRKVTQADKEVVKHLKIVDRNDNVVDLSKYNIGKISFEGFIYDRTPKILSLGVQDKRGLKEYLDTNGGIKVYRDGIRINEYGEEGNDWLSLDIRRVNMPTKRISNNIILAAINLRRADSEDLIEKTNREGFVENEAYQAFVKSVLYALNLVETFRNTDKEKIRTFYSQESVSEPVVSSLSELQIIIEKRLRDSELKNEINKYLKKIEHDYKNMSEILLRSAGAGLNMSIVIHEIEKIIAELKKVVEKEKPSERIVALVKHLAKLLEGYSFIIKNTGVKINDLKDVIKKAIFNIEFRLEAHKIEIVRDFESYTGKSKVSCAENLVIASIMNIIDNSIWWLEYGEIKRKKILIKISDELPDYTSMVIADNGPGFSLPPEELVKPFVSTKPYGIGLGLHLSNEIMNANRGILFFPDKGDYSLPEEFDEGATIALCFKNKE